MVKGINFVVGGKGDGTPRRLLSPKMFVLHRKLVALTQRRQKWMLWTRCMGHYHFACIWAKAMRDEHNGPDRYKAMLYAACYRRAEKVYRGAVADYAAFEPEFWVDEL